MTKILSTSCLILSISLVTSCIATGKHCPMAIQVYASHTANSALNYIHAHNTQDLHIIKQHKPGKTDIYKVVHGCYTNHQSASHDLIEIQAKNKAAWLTTVNQTISTQTKASLKSKKIALPTPNHIMTQPTNSIVLKSNHTNCSKQHKIIVKYHITKYTDKAQSHQNIIKQKITQHNTATKKHAKLHAAKVKFTINDGSLMQNAYEFGKEFNYHVIWDVTDKNSGAKADYEWVGKTAVTRTNPLSIIHMMMTTYPVNVKVWNANRVICITNTGSCDE